MNINKIAHSGTDVADFNLAGLQSDQDMIVIPASLSAGIIEKDKVITNIND